jgi:hypothetical protein
VCGSEEERGGARRGVEGRGGARRGEEERGAESGVGGTMRGIGVGGGRRGYRRTTHRDSFHTYVENSVGTSKGLRRFRGEKEG